MEKAPSGPVITATMQRIVKSSRKCSPWADAGLDKFTEQLKLAVEANLSLLAAE